MAAAAPPLLSANFRESFVDSDDEELFFPEGAPFSTLSAWLPSPKAAAAYVASMLSALAAA